MRAALLLDESKATHISLKKYARYWVRVQAASCHRLMHRPHLALSDELILSLFK